MKNESNIKLIRNNYESGNACSQEKLKGVSYNINLNHIKYTH